MVDIKKALWSNHPMRAHDNQLLQPICRIGGSIIARTWPSKLDLLALGSLLALLIMGRGAGAG